MPAGGQDGLHASCGSGERGSARFIAGRDRLRLPCPGLHETRALRHGSFPPVLNLTSTPTTLACHGRYPSATAHCCGHSTRSVIVVQPASPAIDYASPPSARATLPHPHPASPASLTPRTQQDPSSAPVQPASTPRRFRSRPVHVAPPACLATSPTLRIHAPSPRPPTPW
jgi:hypothetical protein